MSRDAKAIGQVRTLCHTLSLTEANRLIILDLELQEFELKIPHSFHGQLLILVDLLTLRPIARVNLSVGFLGHIADSDHALVLIVAVLGYDGLLMKVSQFINVV